MARIQVSLFSAMTEKGCCSDQAFPFVEEDRCYGGRFSVKAILFSLLSSVNISIQDEEF